MENLQIILDRIWKSITIILFLAAFISFPFAPSLRVMILDYAIMFTGGGLAYWIAKEKGRKGYWPFIFGAVWSIWAIVYYLLIKDEKEKEK